MSSHSQRVSRIKLTRTWCAISRQLHHTFRCTLSIRNLLSPEFRSLRLLISVSFDSSRQGELGPRSVVIDDFGPVSITKADTFDSEPLDLVPCEKYNLSYEVPYSPKCPTLLHSLSSPKNNAHHLRRMKGFLT